MWRYPSRSACLTVSTQVCPRKGQVPSPINGIGVQFSGITNSVHARCHGSQRECCRPGWPWPRPSSARTTSISSQPGKPVQVNVTTTQVKQSGLGQSPRSSFWLRIQKRRQTAPRGKHAETRMHTCWVTPTTRTLAASSFSTKSCCRGRWSGRGALPINPQSYPKWKSLCCNAESCVFFRVRVLPASAVMTTSAPF